MYQIGIVGGNVTVNVGALSYAGQLNIAVIGDPEAVPDLAVVAAGMADTLDQLGATLPSGHRPPESTTTSLANTTESLEAGMSAAVHARRRRNHREWPPTRRRWPRPHRL